MKKILICFLTLLGLTQALAQEYEYVPFVREGVKWVYDPSENEAILELKGDSVISGKTYKVMHCYHGDNINTDNDTVAVLLREENKVVYGIVPNGKTYAACPIICLGSPAFDELVSSGQEFILYDFNNPLQYYSEILNPGMWDNMLHHFTDTIEINGRKARRHVLSYLSDFCIIEGIGYDGCNPYGYTLAYQYPILVGEGYGSYTSTPRLFCVIEDGDTIYKAMNYRSSRNVLPFVREGVKWVNEKVIINNGDTTCYYYTYQFYGTGEGSNWPTRDSYACHYSTENHFPEVTDSVIAYCLDDRIGSEHNMLCYDNQSAISIIEKRMNLIDYSYFYPVPNENKLLQLYAFNGYDICPSNTVNHYIDKQVEPFLNRHNFVESTSATIEGEPYLRYAYIGEDGDTLAYVVEGIGFDSRDMGDLLTPFTRRPDPAADYQEWCGLSHVIKDGEIIYKGMRYREGAADGIDEVVADKEIRPTDANYYDLTGRRTGTEVPQSPGIYIHQGKKIVVR